MVLRARALDHQQVGIATAVGYVPVFYIGQTHMGGPPCLIPRDVVALEIDARSGA